MINIEVVLLDDDLVTDTASSEEGVDSKVVSGVGVKIDLDFLRVHFAEIPSILVVRIVTSWDFSKVGQVLLVLEQDDPETSLANLGVLQGLRARNRNSCGSCEHELENQVWNLNSNMACLLYTSPSPRDQRGSRMPSSA